MNAIPDILVQEHWFSEPFRRGGGQICWWNGGTTLKRNRLRSVTTPLQGPRSGLGLKNWVLSPTCANDKVSSILFCNWDRCRHLKPYKQDTSLFPIGLFLSVWWLKLTEPANLCTGSYQGTCPDFAGAIGRNSVQLWQGFSRCSSLITRSVVWLIVCVSFYTMNGEIATHEFLCHRSFFGTVSDLLANLQLSYLCRSKQETTVIEWEKIHVEISLCMVNKKWERWLKQNKRRRSLLQMTRRRLSWPAESQAVNMEKCVHNFPFFLRGFPLHLLWWNKPFFAPHRSALVVEARLRLGNDGVICWRPWVKLYMIRLVRH